MNSRIPIVLAALALVSGAAFGGPITYTYNYTGNAVYCSYGACPANITSDYATASVTLNTQAAPNVGVNWLAPAYQQYLVSWVFGDALGYVNYASTDPNASSEVTYLAFNGAGTDYTIATASPASEFDIFDPPMNVPSINGGTYQVADHLAAANGSWQGTSPNPGQWSLSVNGEQGGTASAPVFLTTFLPVSSVSGTTSGDGSMDYYSFYWAGGAFSASTDFSNILSSGDMFQFSLGLVGSCNTLASATLNGTNNYTGSISQGNLSPGTYCIGIDQTAGSDPNYVLTFQTPLSSAVPEPGTFVILWGGLAVIAAARRGAWYRRGGRSHNTPRPITPHRSKLAVLAERSCRHRIIAVPQRAIRCEARRAQRPIRA